MLKEKNEEKEIRELTPWIPSGDISHEDQKVKVVYRALSSEPSFDLLEEIKNQENNRIPEQPTIEVHLENQDLVVKVDLSTIGKDDLQINLQGDLLTIKKEKKKEEELKGQNHACSRFVYGSFERWG
ncbi:MAG: Hsp20 family protein [Nitrospiria bacterium]